MKLTWLLWNCGQPVWPNIHDHLSAKLFSYWMLFCLSLSTIRFCGSTTVMMYWPKSRVILKSTSRPGASGGTRKVNDGAALGGIWLVGARYTASVVARVAAAVPM